MDRVENPETDGSRDMNRENQSCQFEGANIYKPELVPERDKISHGNPEMDVPRVGDRERDSDHVTEFETDIPDWDADVSIPHEENWRARSVQDTWKIRSTSGERMCRTGDKVKIGRGTRGRQRVDVPGEVQSVNDPYGLERSVTLEYSVVCELAEREPSEIIQVLLIALDSGGLQICLNRCSHDKEYLKAILKILAKACECHSMDASILLILNAVRQESFMDVLVDYITFLTKEVSEGYMDNPIQEVRDIIFVGRELCIRMPTACLTLCLGLHASLYTVVSAMINSPDGIDDSVTQDFKAFDELKNNLLKGGEHRRKTEKEILSDKEKPEDDFREYEVFPRSIDLDTNIKPFMRKNKKQGSYEDLDHYLDVQYRLLREDFVGPLRDGIAELLQVLRDKRKTKRLQGVRFYNHVRIVAPACSESGLCYVIQFDISNSRVHWESSKRLLYGSLLCLSHDHFKTFYFATVTVREPQHLEDGLLQVKMEHDYDTVQKIKQFEFIMVETSAYFEAYRHVLTGLQKIRPGDLPFEKYIVRCETEIEPPVYLRQNPNTSFDLRPLVDNDFVVKDKFRLKETESIIRKLQTDSFSVESSSAKDVNILKRSSWPSADLLHLNHSQYESLISALTKEFVIIQGPPGTGKTYIGLKIVKALLYNQDVWRIDPSDRNSDPRPMLVVCYTNHALDQFLEGIIHFYKGNIVRVGSRSSSIAMKDCSIKELRNNITNEIILENKEIAKIAFLEIKTRLKAIENRVRETETGILHENLLQPFMDKAYVQLTDGFEKLFCGYPQVKKKLRNKYSVIVEWLGLGNVAPNLQVTEDNETKEQNQMQNCHLDQHSLRGEERKFDMDKVHVTLEETGGHKTKMENEIAVVNDVDAIQAERLLDNCATDYDKPDMAQSLRVDEYNLLYRTAVTLSIENIDKLPSKMKNEHWEIVRKQKTKIKNYVRRQLCRTEMMSKAEADRLQNIWTMHHTKRWCLYRRWIFLYKGYLSKQISSEEVDRAAERCKNALMQVDKDILRRATVIGMTTTGAAKYQSILQEIRPRIIVVEEAAEVLEAHIIATLNSDCEHLILIGDHKQLKPNPSVFKLARDYNLDLSLFERMIKNGIEWNSLHLQHRMRPQIADLVRNIYDHLQDHESVQNLEPIKGVTSCVYFVNHTYPEKHDDDSKSHSNTYEAEFTAGFCRYLLQQGYNKSQITVLTLYSGQLYCLKNVMPKDEFQGIRVTVVDNYQGEENDIIILSLVRSNKDGKIGFVGVENRICVALSRAKKGLYVIGNFNLLSKCSSLWKEMVQSMQNKGLLGQGLKLYCQNHPKDASITAFSSTDFNNAPNGGCSKKCEYRLNCGHACQMFCHPLDPEHKFYKCLKQCEEIMCASNHKCKKMCYQQCGDCEESVTKTIPKCGHEQVVPCYLDPALFSCRNPCETILSCGHRCQEMCGSMHTRNCTYLVEKTLSCSHTQEVFCHVKTCSKPCMEILKCGHQCEGTCADCSEGRLHKQCIRECNKILVCGHHCNSKCDTCPPCMLKCENRCSHIMCMKPCGEECMPCIEPCDWRCAHYQCTKLCFEPCNRPRCNYPCKKRLPCKHSCIGICGEPCPDMCRVCHRDEVTRIYFGSEDEPNARFIQLEDCKHVLEVRGLDMWMDTYDEQDGDSTIQLKVCPRCKTPIRRNLRYNLVVKRTLLDIERVKTIVQDEEKRRRGLREDLESKLSLQLESCIYRRQRCNLSMLQTRLQEGRSEQELVTLMNQTTFLISLMKLQEQFEIHKVTLPFDRVDVLCDLMKLQSWLLMQRNVLTDQEIDDAQQELARFEAWFNMTRYCTDIKCRKCELDKAMKEDIDVAEKIVSDRKKFSADRRNQVQRCLQKLKNLCPLLAVNIVEEERTAIIKTMGLRKEYWLKSSNGDIYATGEYGREIEETEDSERCVEKDAVKTIHLDYKQFKFRGAFSRVKNLS
ncbi:hypothetical protein CHS0354_015183 [Potamilus streckersoni]|uniref:NF-X1-type domain-containing protein n=1 Tax=Potamilus streckersoni TaxID=2493646 RepID=A0AAE0SD59_9BIVA|nr:hypothetical protein CHS0354_015183 [Potamilus streckersoni]